MATGTTTVTQCRWDQVEVGDTIMCESWRWQRWVTIDKIVAKPGQVEVWWGGGHDKRGYTAHAANLVSVQVSD